MGLNLQLQEVKIRTRPTVAFYLHNFAHGGVQRVFVTLANWFAGQGYPTRILVLDPEGPLRKHLTPCIQITELEKGSMLKGRFAAVKGFRNELRIALAPLIIPLTPPNCLRAVPSMAAALRASPPDILFSAKPHFNVLTLLAKRLAGVPTRLVMTQHTSLYQRKTRTRKFRESRLDPLMAFGYQQAEALVGVSTHVSRELTQCFSLDPARVHTIFNPAVPANLEDFVSQGRVHPWLLEKTEPVILAAGRMGRVKDYATLLRALAILRKKQPARLLLFSGASENRKQIKRQKHLQALSQELGLEESFQLEPFSDDLLANMAQADVFAISSLSEGFGNVVAEALACGCPVVSTDTEGPSEILEQGRHGTLVPPGDPVAMAEALSNTLNAPVDRTALQQRARCFSVQRAGRKYEGLVQELLGICPVPTSEGYRIAAG